MSSHTAQITLQLATVRDLQSIIDCISAGLKGTVPETPEDLDRGMLGEEMQQLMFNSRQLALLTKLQTIQGEQLAQLDQSMETFQMNIAFEARS